LEELDGVAGRIVEHDLLASRPADHVAAEDDARGAKPFDLRLDVVDDQVDPVPSGGPG